MANNSSGGPEFIYSPLFDTDLAMPEWEAVLTIVSLTVVISSTIVGNILVIISVFTYAPLKITPNFFIVSLAAADLTVSVCVLPFNVVYIVVGRWLFGPVLCKMWLTSDVLCCTASILNLCAIAIDRYQVKATHRIHGELTHCLSYYNSKLLEYVPKLIIFRVGPSQPDWGLGRNRENAVN